MTSTDTDSTHAMVRAPRTRITGLAEIRAALDAGGLRLLLVQAGIPELQPLADAARTRGVRIWSGSAGDLRRMSPDSAHPELAIGMGGDCPVADAPLAEALATGGAFWLLAGVSYPSNVGFVIRTAEVSGATAVVVDGTFNREARSRIEHVSMGATRLLGVHYAPSLQFIEAARAAGYRVVGIESEGPVRPWSIPLDGNVVLVVGAERDGIPKSVLDACDAIACLPMRGFVPSYNLQAAVSAVALERLRQLGA